MDAHSSLSKGTLYRLQVAALTLLGAACFLFFRIPHAHAASVKYWIGTGTGAFNVPGNWSLTSGGSPTTTTPTAGDALIFDAGSSVGAHITSSMTGGSIFIQSGYTGNISISGSTVVTLSTLTIGRSSSKVIMGTNSKLILQASGTPLTGSGTLDTTTNTPNTVEYTGPATTNITAAAPAAAYNNLTLDPHGFARDAVINLNSGEKSDFNSTVIDTTTGFAYIGTYTSPSTIVKIRLSDLTRIGALILNSGEVFSSSACLDSQNDFAYFGLGSAPGVVAKIRLSDLTRIGTITLNSGENYPYACGIDTTSGYAYFIADVNPGIIVKVRLSDFTRVGALTLNSGETTYNAAPAIDAANGFMYVSVTTSPASIVKIRLSDFTRVASLSLNSGENNIRTAAIDTQNGFLYVGTQTFPGVVVKIRLSDFTRVGAITLNSGENSLNASSIDTQNGFLYVVCHTSPGIAVKIRLSDFTRVGAVTLNSGENLPWSSGIDPANGFLYLPTYGSDPIKVIRVSLGSTSMPIGTAASQTLTVNNALTIGDGTNAAPVTADTYNPALSILGNITINATGSLVAPASSSFTITGNFINNGTLTPNGGTVTLNGTNATFSGGTSFYNLVINAAKSAIMRAAATITHALTINAGSSITLNGNTLTATNASIGNAGTITIGTGSLKHASSYAASPSSLTLGGLLTLTVTDANRNLDGTTPESFTVSDGQENITLLETGNATGIFTGSIPTSYGNPAGNSGTFEFDPGSSCSASTSFSYTDNQDNTDSSTATVTLSAPSSCTPTTQTSGTTNASSGGGGGGSGLRMISVSIPATTPFSNNTTIANSTTTFVSTGNVLIDGTIKRLNARVEKMLAKNPNSVFAKAIQRRIAELIARVKKH
jgi:hypothetical protein